MAKRLDMVIRIGAEKVSVKRCKRLLTGEVQIFSASQGELWSSVVVQEIRDRVRL